MTTMILPMVWTFIKMSPPKKNTQPPQSSKPPTSKPQTNVTSEDIYRLLII